MKKLLIILITIILTITPICAHEDSSEVEEIITSDGYEPWFSMDINEDLKNIAIYIIIGICTFVMGYYFASWRYEHKK
ncbi:hypothetical protein [Methanobrevibacter sp. DSM 116169]|uniref:hypothetical protein n=1 Tax=Methanobrevibacter sp. DSM 116169 TaxID=3242727 RepID=UPI0038FCDD81